MLLKNNQRPLIFLLSSVALITLPHFWHIPLSIFGFFCAMLLWRFIAIWKTHWLPHQLILLLLIVGGIALLLSHFRSFLGRDAGTSLFVIALSLKLLEIKQDRDLYLISYLAFIIASSQFLFEQSILMAVYILFICGALLTTLIIINTQQPKTREAIKKSALIIAQALPMTLVLFFLFPRIQAPDWIFFNDPNASAKTGLSDTLEPGSITNLALSAELAFRVKFENDNLPPPRQRYWRGPVYSYTNGKRWTASWQYAYAPYMDAPKFNGKAYKYTVLLEPQNKNWVYALDMPAQFSTNIHKNQHHQLINKKHSTHRSEHQIVSYPDYNTGYITKGEFKENTQLPSPPSEKLNNFVQQLKGFDAANETFINNLLQHFKTEDFYYTLSPPLMEENPIEAFLFETRRGFCSHYATSFVYLMRIANIPARVIGGYQGGEFNRVGKFLEIRQADAHAWAEVWLENKGWVRVDPTAAVAPERVERGVDIDEQLSQRAVNFMSFTNKNYSWLKKSHQLWQSLDYSWQRWVVQYDTGNQSHFLSSLGINNLKTTIYWMMGLITFITLVLAAYLFKNNHRSIDKASLYYLKFCRTLAKAGLARQINESANDFAVRVKYHFPEQQQKVTTITHLYNQLRYGKYPSEIKLKKLQIAVNKYKVKAKNKKS